jgi:hypothetical protein
MYQNETRNENILTARLSGCTLQEIGTTMGLSRQRIAQVVIAATKRMEAQVEIKERLCSVSHRNKHQTGQIKIPKIKGFMVTSVQKWLKEIGFRYCSFASHVVCLDMFGKDLKMCRSCNSGRHSEWIAKNYDKHRAAVKQWQDANPEKCRGYTLKHFKKYANALEA